MLCKTLLLPILMVLLVLCGCARSTEPPVTPAVSIPAPSPSEAYVPPEHLAQVAKVPASMWWMFPSPPLSWDGCTMVAEAMYLDDDETTVIYSLSGDSGRNMAERFKLRLENDKGYGKSWQELVPLAELDGLEIGFVRFGRRPYTSKTLSLTLYALNEDAVVSTAEIAQHNAPYPLVPDRSGAQYRSARQGNTELAGFEVDAGLGPAKGPTSPPVDIEPGDPLPARTIGARYRPAPTQAAPWDNRLGAEVVTMFYVDIHNTAKGQAHRISAQLLSDGGVVARVDDRVVAPEPIIVAEPTWSAYP